ncbi:DUF6456 domain-containing protein [soil metagenome]
MSGPDAVEALRERAADRLARPEAWLEATGATYAIRRGGDRRRTPLMTLDEAVFEALTLDPGLSPRKAGGWRTPPRPNIPPAPLAPPPGRPGVIEGERSVVEADGRLTVRRANLGEGALGWLAARKDAQGRAWLDARALAAAGKLRADHEACGIVGRLTMSWDAGPRGSGGERLEPAERGRVAKARLRAALEALSARQQAVIERIVLLDHPLQAVERHLGLKRRTARDILKAALEVLARHYRI